MHWLGATVNEVLFVALLIAIVLAAPKMPRLGERIGSLFAGRREEKRAPGPGDEG
jgi:hypothetical protein